MNSKPKQNPSGKAPWMTAFPSQVGRPTREFFNDPSRAAKRPRPKTEEELYAEEAREFVAAAAKRGETCPVVAAVESLRTGRRYGHPVSAKVVHVHHVRGRSGPLLRDRRFWMALSMQGHRWVHANQQAARELGFLCPEGEWCVPVPPGVEVPRPPGLFSFKKNQKNTCEADSVQLGSPRETATDQDFSSRPSPAGPPPGGTPSSLSDGGRGGCPTSEDDMSDGMVYLNPGDVLRLDGELHVVDFVNDSRARAVPLTKRQVKIRPATGPDAGSDVAFQHAGNAKNVCPRMEKSCVVCSIGQTGLARWRKTGELPAGVPGQPANPPAAAKPAGPAKPAAGRLGTLFGASVCSVLKAAGAAGATPEAAAAVLAKHGLKAAASTVALNIKSGQKRAGKMAELTPAQLKEFGL